MAKQTLDGTGRIPGILNQIAKYKFNPAAIQKVVLQHLKDVTNGDVDIVDPTNPFVFCLESSAVNTAAFMVENEANTRRQYPAVSQTPEDLYIHMSDKDFVDRFSTPATTTFSIIIQKEDLLDKLVFDPVTLGKKVTIPRNTEFTIADTVFSLQYPIDIKQLLHGGLQIVYDTSEVSPLQQLATNIIDFEIRTDSNKQELLYFEVLVQQFNINSSTAAISTTTGFNQAIELTDNFHYARVYYKDSTSNLWKEIRTTHTDQVYDPNTPTAVFTLIDKTLTVHIPQIYLNTNSIRGTLRIDVYETKGYLNMTLDSYNLSAFSAKFKNIDKSYDTTYTAAIATLNIFAYSSKPINGGTPALTYDQLRKRVIDNAIGDRNLPITNVQIESTLEKQGYSVVKNVDVVTNRVFLATRALPKPIDDKLITAAASSIETLIITVDKAITYDGVMNNGGRITLTPEIIYTNNSGIIKIFPKQEVTSLLSNSPGFIAEKVTAQNFLYSPFHYVLDTTGNEFQVRPYFLDRPVAPTVRFISQNDTSGLQVNTQNYNISRSTTGFKLTIVTKSNTVYQELDDANIHVQLSYVPVNEKARAYLNGVQTGKTADNERIFEFDLSSNFDVDSNDNITLSKFLIITEDPKLLGTPLRNEFDVIYSTTSTAPSNFVVSGIDVILGKFALPPFAIGITQEKMTVVFGYSLNTLWARSRSVVSSSEYQLHTSNVPWTYEKDEYLQNTVTGSNFSFDVNNDIVYTKLHSVGDPVLDANGDPLYRYRIGDVVLDPSGLPVPTDVNKVIRQLDMMFIEGAYAFATDFAASNYRNSIVDTVVGWLTIDLATMGSNLLEQTKLFFYPKTTMGSIQVLADNGQVTSVEAGQAFKVVLYVTRVVYQNSDLRETLRKSTIDVIDAILKNETVSTSIIISQLRTVYANDVISLTISGLGGEKNLAAITILTSGDRCNIRKRLVKLPDDKLIVTEDVTVEYVLYEVPTK